MIWEKAYRYWASKRGLYKPVKKMKYVGLRGWKGHIQKKIFEEVEYAGEVYECMTPEGDIIKCVFRILYEEVNNTYKEKNKIKEEFIIEERPNFHTDGIKCWKTGNYKHYDDRSLRIKKEELQNKINKLKKIFSTMNNINNSELKLAIQLYLRRLETPDYFTSRDWKNCTIKQEVINLL